MADSPKKGVLAYSGGLDTSIILRWLQDTYRCEVVTFTADLGQGEDLEPARAKARLMGIKEIYVEDLREEFVRDFVFPMFRANTVYERSEEHTSELQSLMRISYAVFCLKKNNTKIKQKSQDTNLHT